MTGELLIQLEEVTLRDGQANAFAGTTWAIRQGEHWGVVGAAGSGKSLLARALAGGVALWSGRIRRCEGRVELVSFESQRALINRVSGFHQARWYAQASEQAATVAELLSRQAVEGVSPYQVLPPEGAQAYEQRMEAIVGLLDIGPLLERKALQLSNGETRKLVLARALLRQPRVLILDDPFAGLDSAYRATFEAILEALAREVTLVCVTGHPDELPRPITHLLGIEAQRIVFQAPRHTVTDWQIVRQSTLSTTIQGELPAPTPATGTLVELEDVSVRYGASTIIDGITWRVNAGESWALLGPNGSGKTTLLSLIQGDNPQAYANRVTLFGRRRGSGESIWELKSRIGSVAPEMQAHYPAGTSCLQVVASGFFASLGLFREPSPEQWREASAWLERLGLAGAAGQPLNSLEAGAQRLVLLARALVNHPPLLILDEPCQGLDDGQRDAVVGLIDCLCRQPGRAVIYVTHHLDEIPPAVTHLFQLDHGRCTSCGPRVATGPQP